MASSSSSKPSSSSPSSTSSTSPSSSSSSSNSSTCSIDQSLAYALQQALLLCDDDAAYAHRLALAEYGIPTPPISVTAASPNAPSPICPICLEQVPKNASFVTTSCAHIICEHCMRQHVNVIATDTKQYPIPCPSCGDPVDPQACLALMAGTGNAHEMLERLVLEKAHFSRIRYCADEKCAMPFDWVEEEDTSNILLKGEEFKVVCPMCETATCVQCRVKWHEGQTCEQHESEKGDQDLLLRLSREKGWKECPKCGNMIERQEGDCFFVHCRCGCAFCHRCGVEYRSLHATDDNTHGTAGCACGLFGDEFSDEDEILEWEREIGLFPPRDMPLGHAFPAAIVLNQIGRVAVLQNDLRQQLDVDEVMEGRNGYVAIMAWLGNPRRRRKLPAAMRDNLSAATCPYDECKAVFNDIRGLEQHLTSVQRHPVFLCCGRPFYTQHGRENHMRAVHGDFAFLAAL